MFCFAACLVLSAVPSGPAQNVVLIVSDGVRTHEIFEGADRSLMGRAGGVENEEGLAAKYWRPTAPERREALMPFLWKRVATQGQLFGDVTVGSPARITNTRRCSYPGYNELFTGAADPRIETNEHGPNPNVTVFEWLNRRPGFEGQVQAFATWETFFNIFNVQRSRLDVRAGWNPPFEKDLERTSGKDALDQVFRTTTQQFGGNALDGVTYAALKESLKTRRPRVLFLGLGETDEWMHAGRYDLTLEALHRADATIEDLWNTLQALPEYRGTTTFLITTDHGRGTWPWDWRHHGANVSGAEAVWVAAMGPGVPALGVRRETGLITQGQVAATLAQLLGEDWRTVTPRAAPALPLLSAPSRFAASSQVTTVGAKRP
jgi:hypothetical protein